MLPTGAGIHSHSLARANDQISIGSRQHSLRALPIVQADQTDDRQADNPYRAPGEGEGIAQPRWQWLPSMALHLCALFLGMLAITMAYQGARWIEMYRRAGGLGLAEVALAIALLLGALILASGAAVLICIARRINRRP